jgi:spermidine synthase
VSLNYQEIDFQRTALGDLILRRRRLPSLGDLDVYEIKLGNDFLMTSLFHESETQLARLALNKHPGDCLNVVVGGLGLGYTAVEALESEKVKKLSVIEYLEPVIHWHHNGILPIGTQVSQDQRCEIIHADFFQLASKEHPSFNPKDIQAHDIILLDIDHSPNAYLNPSHQDFYTSQGIDSLKSKLKGDGIFGLWSDGKTDPDFLSLLQSRFRKCEDHLIEFDNILTGGTSVGTVYLGFK